MGQWKNRKHIGFWTNQSIKDQKLTEWIDNSRLELSYSEFLRKILTDVMDEKLIVPTTEDLKNKKIKVDIEFKQIMTKIKKKELLYWTVFHKTPSSQGLVAMKVGVDNQIINANISCFDEKNSRLVCPQCQETIQFSKDQSDLKDAKLLFIDHYFKEHGEMSPRLERELTDLE